MKVINIHERRLPASAERVGALIDTLASREDALWPRHCWPRMALDRPLGVGASGGHGPIGYVVDDYQPGRAIRFRFTRPKGFNGWHGLDIADDDGDGVILRHTLCMTTHGMAVASWAIVFRPLHDALLKDALATAEASLGRTPKLTPWSAWVRSLRWIASAGKATAQTAPSCKTA